MPDRDIIRLDCTECQFTRVVDPDDDEQPSDVIVRHGEKTGHTLSVTRVDEEGE